MHLFITYECPPPLFSFIIHFQTNRRYLNVVGGEFEKKNAARHFGTQNEAKEERK